MAQSSKNGGFVCRGQPFRYLPKIAVLYAGAALVFR
jgi:hypothetical protein